MCILLTLHLQVELKLMLSSPFILSSSSSPLSPQLSSSVEKPDGKTRVDFSCFFSAGIGIHRHSASPFLVLPELSKHLLATQQCLFHSQGTLAHEEWDMLQTLLHPCLSFLLTENKGPRREVVHRLYSLIPDVLAEDSDAGGFSRGCCWSPWLSAEGQSLPVPTEGLEEILLGGSMDRVVE